MKIVRYIPNFLTVSRICATILLDGIMIYNFEVVGKQCDFKLFLLITVFIYLSDFIDGRLARYSNCTSLFGEKADIVADLFYMLTQMIVLIQYKYMNVALIFMVLLEFIIFVITSLYHSKNTKVKTLWFDKIGGIAAIYYYIMPLLYVIIHEYSKGKVQIGLLVFANAICCFFTVTAIMSRVEITSLMNNKLAISIGKASFDKSPKG